jgi:hypothetical protein
MMTSDKIFDNLRNSIKLDNIFSKFFTCEVKPHDKGIPEIRDLGQCDSQVGSHNLGILPSRQLTHCKASSEHYHEFKNM